MTRQALETLLWRATMLALGLDPDDPSQAIQRRVRKSWPSSDTVNPNWLRDEDVVFLRLSPGMDDFGTQHDVSVICDPETGIASHRVTYQRAWQVNWVCYGPNSDADADRIRIGIIHEPAHDLLLSNNFAIQPNIPNPIRAPELDETGEWWERSDVTAQAYELVERDYPTETIEQPPDIIVNPNQEV